MFDYNYEYILPLQCFKVHDRDVCVIDCIITQQLWKLGRMSCVFTPAAASRIWFDQLKIAMCFDRFLKAPSKYLQYIDTYQYMYTCIHMHLCTYMLVDQFTYMHTYGHVSIYICRHIHAIQTDSCTYALYAYM